MNQWILKKEPKKTVLWIVPDWSDGWRASMRLYCQHCFSGNPAENPIIATSINKNNYTWNWIQKNGRVFRFLFSRKKQERVIQKLGFVSGKDHDKYEGIDYRMQDGLPILNEKMLRCADL